MDWKRIASSTITGLWFLERIVGLAGLPEDIGWWRGLMYHIPNEIGLFALGVFVTLMLQSHGSPAIKWVKGFWQSEDMPDESSGKFTVWLKREARDMMSLLVFFFVRLPIMVFVVLLVLTALINLLIWFGIPMDQIMRQE